MHTKVDYSEIKDEAKKREAALCDIESWLGSEKFNSLDGQFRHFVSETMPPRRFVMMLAIGGIQGYPVFAWYCSLYGPLGEAKFNAYLGEEE